MQPVQYKCFSLFPICSVILSQYLTPNSCIISVLGTVVHIVEGNLFYKDILRERKPPQNYSCDYKLTEQKGYTHWESADLQYLRCNSKSVRIEWPVSVLKFNFKYLPRRS